MSSRSRLLALVLLGLAVLAPGLPADAPEPTVEAVEKEMRQRPAEAPALARRAAATLADRPRAEQLLALAAQLQEARLPQLTEAQVSELADLCGKDLRDPQRARRAQRTWLSRHGEALGPADGPGRLHLARLALRWLDDADWAARLCREAWSAVADPSAAARMFKDANLSAVETRQLLGPPARIARQILYRRHLEVWTYDSPGLRIEFDCVRGQEPLVISVQKTSSAKS